MRKYPLPAFAGLFSFALCAGFSPQTATAAVDELPERIVPDAVLTDENSRLFHLSSLRGTPWVADFIFTSCAGQCPEMTAQMRKLQELLPDQIHLVSITVDPKRDTPKVLSAYARHNGAQPGRWHFLTGKLEEIEQLCKKGFWLSFSKDDPLMHNIRFVLVDQRGKIIGAYDSSDPPSVQALILEANELLR